MSTYDFSEPICYTGGSSTAAQIGSTLDECFNQSINPTGCERAFSQMGLTHTKLSKKLGHAKTAAGGCRAAGCAETFASYVTSAP